MKLPYKPNPTLVRGNMDWKLFHKLPKYIQPYISSIYVETQSEYDNGRMVRHNIYTAIVEFEDGDEFTRVPSEYGWESFLYYLKLIIKVDREITL